MTHGYFDYASSLLRRPDTAAWLAKAFSIDAERELRAASIRFGMNAWVTALWQQIRGLSPFLRSLGRLVRQRLR